MERLWSEFRTASYKDRIFPRSLYLARGMLSPDEMRMLFAAAADFYRGAGQIVDAGAFAGMSAYCLATGVTENRDLVSRGRCIHSYDLFETDDSYTRDYIRNVFYTSQDVNGNKKGNLYIPGINEDFLEIFWHQNLKYAHLIEAHKGDFTQQAWNKAGIEILFVDVCKTRSLQNHLLLEFLPSLIPGESIVIQQDFHHPWHPYIHIAMEILAPNFEILISREGGSRVYLFKEDPSPNNLKEAVQFKYDEGQLRDIFGSICANSPENERPLLKVAFVAALKQGGMPDRAKAAASDLTSQMQATEFAPLLSQLEKMVNGL